MARLRSWLLLLLCLTAVATLSDTAEKALRPFEHEAPAPPDELGERDGELEVVATREDGAAVVGAAVTALTLVDEVAYRAAEARTDDSGSAWLRSLPRGEHWIGVEKDGFARASRRVAIVPGARRLEVALTPEVRVPVEVRDERGEPVIGAEIEARGGDPYPVGARAGDDGNAVVARLAGPGPITLRVRAPGYEEARARVTSWAAPVRVTLRRASTLVVRVRDPQGAPAAGAEVLVRSATLGPARVTTTGADGTVRIAGLSADSYTLRARKGSLASADDELVTLEASEEKSVELTLGTGRFVDVLVRGDGEAPLAGARVVLTEHGLSSFPMQATTDHKGRARLGPASGDSLVVSASADGYVGASAVAGGESQGAPLTLDLVRGGAVVGRVRDARGFPVAGATLRVFGTALDGTPIDAAPEGRAFQTAHFQASLSGPAKLLPAGELGVLPGPLPALPRGPAAPSFSPEARDAAWVSERDGTYRASPVPPGTVRVLVTHPQYVESTSTSVEVRPGADSTVDVVLLRGGDLEGRVVDARGRGVEGAYVEAVAADASASRSTRSASDGSYAFAALGAHAVLLVARSEDPTRVVARVDVDVPEGGRATRDVKLPDARETLPIRVVDGRGAAIEGAQVQAISLDPQESFAKTLFTDNHGDAALDGARGLAIRLEAQAPGFATRVLESPPTAVRATLELDAGERLRGELRDRREAIRDATVTLFTATAVARTRPRDGGIFELTGLSPGRARLEIHAPGYVRVTRDVDVASHGGRRATDLGRIELAVGGSVEGRVVDEAGRPVPYARVARDFVPAFVPRGPSPEGIALGAGDGRFRLDDLPEGAVTLAAYAPGVGRGSLAGVKVARDRTTRDVTIVLVSAGARGADVAAGRGDVAVTLGESDDAPAAVVVVAVAEQSEAERAGLRAGDVLVEVGGAAVTTMGDARRRLGGAARDDVIVVVLRGEKRQTMRVRREEVRR